MITLILAIGFSVEFSAHVTYGFVSGPEELNPRERCIDTLEKLAWPMVHGSMSTILGVLVLAFIDSYMVQSLRIKHKLKKKFSGASFLQNSLSCPGYKICEFKIKFPTVIGVLHALVLLPILLHATVPFGERIAAALKCNTGKQKDIKNSEKAEQIIGR